MFTQAIVRPPAANFAEALTTQDLGPPNYVRALEQHAAYCAALEKCGLTLTRLAADERYPDSTFVEDTAVIIGVINSAAPNRALPDRTSAGAILTRPGAVSRIGEVENIAESLSRFYSELPSIEWPGTLDGGDVCESRCKAECGGGNHFFIGISKRTNEAGARQLAKWLDAHGCSSSFIDIRGMKDLLHLKSGLAYLGDNRLVVIDALAKHRDFGRYELLRVAAGEEYAANCVRVNGHVLVASGYPIFERRLEELGYETICLEMTEFQKMDGGLSCLSLRL